MANRNYIFAGGGTGGHLYPGLAVAQQLMKLRPEAQILFACSDRAIDRNILSNSPYAFAPQAIQPMPRRRDGWGRFIKALVRSRAEARQVVNDLKPAAVFGLGGFAAGPIVRFAASQGIPCCLLSIDAVPGLANRLLARNVKAIFTQYEHTAGLYGSSAAKARVVGCPIRQELLEGSRNEAVAQLGLRPDRKTLLVMAGSLGSANINQAAAELARDLDKLADHWQVLHVSGIGKLAEALQAYAKSRIDHVVLEYCDRMDRAYAAADLVLCRAGASTIGELSALSKPSVLMPYPYHKDQQQVHNAQELVEAGAAVISTDVCEASANAANLRQSLLPILESPSKLEAMHSAAQRHSRPAAAIEIAKWLTAL
jgi:UDP-N-acetylglucosamine--N-acetylmuramyl-(pentapeptide) pyrophosphoryl-undecaprenol N-acetylglucosamine transferase